MLVLSKAVSPLGGSTQPPEPHWDVLSQLSVLLATPFLILAVLAKTPQLAWWIRLSVLPLSVLDELGEFLQFTKLKRAKI